jgi:hypothetical protein
MCVEGLMKKYMKGYGSIRDSLKKKCVKED